MTPFVIVTLIVAVACLLLLLVPWRTASKPPSNRGKPLDTLTSSHARPASVGPPAPQPPKSEDAVLPNNRTPRLLTPQGHVAANTTSTVLDATPPAAVMSAVPSKPLSTVLQAPQIPFAAVNSSAPVPDTRPPAAPIAPTPPAGDRIAVLARGHKLTPLQRLLNITVPAYGSPRCMYRGYYTHGRWPHCQCFPGWGGANCSESQSLPARPKACVVFLMYDTANKEYYRYQKKTLVALDRYFNDRFRYPVVIFHSPKYAQRMSRGQNTTWLDDVRRSTRSQVIFQEVNFQYPKYLRPWQTVKIQCPRYRYPRALNYVHMISFFSLGWFRHPILAEYEYVWRLDGDLALTKPIPCDIFQVMRERNAVLGFYKWKNSKNPASLQCSGPIDNVTAAYAREHRFEPTHLHLLNNPGPTRYCAGWVVFKWSFWTSPDVLHFAEHVARKGLAYYYRLGEQTLYCYAMGLFLPGAALHQFGGLGPFIHKGRFQIWPDPNDRPSNPNYAADPYCKAPGKG